MQFIISTTDEVLIPQAGLGLVGALLQDTKLRQRVDAIDVEGYLRPEVKHGDVVSAAIGLLCLGKSDFNDIEAFREDEFFRQALGLRQIPSEPTLRQRLDAMHDACGPILREESALLLRKHARKPTPCHGQWVALRSVIQDLMYLSAKLTRRANRWKPSFWQNSPWGATWRGLYSRFCGSPIVRSG